MWILLEYLCEPCGLAHESLEPRDAPAEAITCLECGATCPRVLSAPHVSMPLVTVERGDNAPRPDGHMSTRSIADGESFNSWKQRRKQQRIEARRKQLRADL